MSGRWRPKAAEDTELIGPFECPDCGFHMGVDFTYLEQVGSTLLCPVPECNFVGQVQPEDQEGSSGYRLMPERR